MPAAGDVLWAYPHRQIMPAAAPNPIHPQKGGGDGEEFDQL